MSQAANWGALFDLFVLLFARGLGLIALLPFGWTVFGMTQRLTLGMIAAALLFEPALAERTPHLAWLPLEFLIGALVGLPLTLLIAMANFWGQLYDSGRGENIGMLYDPSSDGQTSHTALLISTGLWLLLILSGALGQSLGALSESVKIVAPGTLSAAQLPAMGAAVMKLVAHQLSATCAAFLPFAVMFLLVDLGIGLLARLLPGFGGNSESFLLKTVLGMLGMLGLYQFDIANGFVALAEPNVRALLGR